MFDIGNLPTLVTLGSLNTYVKIGWSAICIKMSTAVGVEVFVIIITLFWHLRFNHQCLRQHWCHPYRCCHLHHQIIFVSFDEVLYYHYFFLTFLFRILASGKNIWFTFFLINIFFFNNNVQLQLYWTNNIAGALWIKH